MAWEKQTEDTNEWDKLDFISYVKVGYWQDGYVVDSETEWVENSTNQNVWIKNG